MSLFQRAKAHLSLTPAERAFLKLLEGFAMAGVVSVAALVTQRVAAGYVSIADLAPKAAAAFAVAALLAVSKYFSARGDQPLADVIAGVAGDLSEGTPGPAPATDPVAAPAA